jgi:SAM-dependent methyltransferase
MAPATQSEAKCWLCGGETKIDPQYAETSLVRCVDCGFLFEPGRDADELQELYGDKYFDEYPGVGDYTTDESQRRFEAQRRIDWIKRFKQSGSIFEVGVAAGFFLDEARSAGFTVAGVEPAPKVSAHARDEFGLDVTTGFIEDAELPPASFDVICAFHVLEHIHDPLDVLKGMRAALKDDGYLLLEIPNIESAMAKRLGPKWLHLDPPNHVGFYTPEQLRGLLASAGFELLETDTVSEFFYYRPSLRLHPTAVTGRISQRLKSGLNQSKPHPTGHALMRITARASSL